MNIDKQKYVHFYVDSVDELQSRPDLMAETMQRASQKVAEQMDDDVKAVMNGAYSAGQLITAFTMNPNQAGDTGFGKEWVTRLVELKRKMSEANIPENDRWIVVHPSTISGIELPHLAYKVCYRGHIT